MSVDITQKIMEYEDGFTKSQRKIADAILTEYDEAVYLTAGQLAEVIGVSESSVVRFAVKLGFKGYTEMKIAIQEMVRARLTSKQRIVVTKKRIGSGEVLDTVLESDISKIRYTLETLDREVFERSVDAILDARNVYVMGARSTEPLARLLTYNLSLIFDNVKFVNPTSSAEVFEQMYSVGSEDTVIAFSFPRYSSKIVNAVKFARQNLAKVVVFTDSEASPLAEFADYLIAAQSDMASFMDSLVAPLSIINAIIVEITRRREEEITARFDKLEKIWDEYDVYAKR